MHTSLFTIVLAASSAILFVSCRYLAFDTSPSAAKHLQIHSTYLITSHHLSSHLVRLLRFGLFDSHSMSVMSVHSSRQCHQSLNPSLLYTSIQHSTKCPIGSYRLVQLTSQTMMAHDSKSSFSLLLIIPKQHSVRP